MLSNFSEYLALDNQRIRHAAFKSLTLALEYSVKKNFYETETNSEESALDGLNFEALNLDDEGKKSLKKFTPQEKVVFHLRYLLTNRFSNSLDLILRLLTTFVQQVGDTFLRFSGKEVLLQIVEMKVTKDQYLSWERCIGAFLNAFKSQTFF